jgi:hypothetical protein
VIPGVCCNVAAASSKVVMPGVIFCQQGGLQTGWASHEIHQLDGVSSVADGIGLGVGVLVLEHATLTMINTTHIPKNFTILFMVCLYRHKRPTPY